MSVVALNILGLVLNLVGVIVLFRYGMPFHVPTGGAINMILEQSNPAAKALERRYEIVGYFGLIAIVVGTGMQIVGAYRAGCSGQPT
jgi:hypothetical protein